MKRTINLLLALLFLTATSIAQKEKFDLFYTCIGSKHYNKDPFELEGGFLGLNDVKGVDTSAYRMAHLFDQMGAQYGTVLASEKFGFLSQKVMLRSVKKMIKKAKSAQAARPLLIVYYCGHGFTAGLHEDHFIVPGDLTKNYTQFEQEDWYDHLLPSLKIRELLDDTGMPYLLLLDCCYEGKQQPIETIGDKMAERFGLQTYQELEGQVYNILLKLNQMVGPDPVVFSAPANKTVSNVDHRYRGSLSPVGPMCRRTFLFVAQLQQQESSYFTIADWVQSLTDPLLDLSDEAEPITAPSVTHCTQDDRPTYYLMVP